MEQRRWRRPATWTVGVLFVVVGLWWLIRWAQHRGYFEWVPEWLFPASGLSAPVSTLLASGGVIIAAGIAFWNGEKTRREERDKWVESKQQDAVRSLRDRYFHITELLSGHSSYAQREAAVYSLAALSDDWASFYGDDTEAAAREQQTCLNVIVGQLRDPLPEKDDHEKDRGRSELIVFKRRVQGVISQRYRPPRGIKQGEWTHLDLDLSYCHLYKPDFANCAFAGKVLLTFTNFISFAIFAGAKFTGFVDSRGAEFGDNTIFRGAEFGDNTTFWKATFGNHTDFWGAKFGDNTIFRDATFGNCTAFWGATFGNHTTFWDATFGDQTTFPDVTFGNHTEFLNTTFGGDSDFQDATFGNHTTFWKSTFDGNSFFQSAEFRDDINFKKAIFHGITDFTRARFLARQTREHREIKNVTRKKAKFEKEPSFNGPSQFNQLPEFNGTQFLTCPALTDGSDPRDFFVGAIFLDEQEVEG